MLSRIATLSLLLGAGCGSRLLGDAAVGMGTAETGGQASSSDGSDADQTGSVDDTIPHGEPPDGDAGLDTGGDDGSGDEAPPPVAECWAVRDLFEVPAEYAVQAVDQDGDGTSEIWVFETVDTGPGPGQTVVYSLDADGNPTSTTDAGGPVFAFVDGDGNGLLDLLTVRFGGGGPPSLGFLAASKFGEFDAMATPVDVDFGEPIVGLMDVTGDGVMDALRFVGMQAVTLHVGTGDGGMLDGGDFPLSGPSSVFAWDIAGVPGLVALQTSVDLEPGPNNDRTGCVPGTFSLFDGSSESLVQIATQPPGASEFGRQLANSADGEVLYVDACDLELETHGVATLVRVDGELQESVLQQGLMWSAVGDFDGDGTADAVWAADADSPVSYQQGLDGLSFAEATPTGIEAALVVPGRMFAVDLNGAGRQQLIRAVRSARGEQEPLLYQSLSLSACPD